MACLVVVGVSHHRAPLEVRERVALDPACWRAFAPARIPTVLLSTCNRLEVYGWASGRPSQVARVLARGLARAAGMPPDELSPYVYVYLERDALRHLVRVAAGLDSLIVGEEQIRGQLRDALRLAETAAHLPAPLRGAFERAAESARRVRGGTRLGKVPSIASAAVHVAHGSLPEGVAGRSVVVLGGGVMARAAAEELVARHAHVSVLNRTPENAARLVAHLGDAVHVGGLDELPRALQRASVVIGATASRHPVLDVETLRAALRQRESRPILLVDIAVPRDIDARARELEGAQLIDLDDLERECPLDLTTRRAELEHAEALAADEAERLADWLRAREVGPAIAELREYAERIRAAELRRSARRLKDLTPEQAAAVDALTAGIVAKLMHGPTVALRDAASSPSGLTRSRSRILRTLRANRERTSRSA